MFFTFGECEEIKLKENYNETKRDIMAMFEIQEKVINSNSDNIRIDATECKSISSTCLAILSSMFLISKDKKIKITFTKKSKLLNTLISNRIY